MPKNPSTSIRSIMTETYKGFESISAYKEARGSRLARWRRKKVAKLSEAQNHRCAYCSLDTYLTRKPPVGMTSKQLATLEHVIPQGRAQQTNKDENLIMACKSCNSLRSDVDAFVFFRTIHDKDYRDNKNNTLMRPNKKERKRNKSLRRKARKAEKDKNASGEKLQRLIEKEERTWALAYTLVTFWPELVEGLIQREYDYHNRTPHKFGRAFKIEQIAERMAA